MVEKGMGGIATGRRGGYAGCCGLWVYVDLGWGGGFWTRDGGQRRADWLKLLQIGRRWAE
ncbi:hypothetical protein TIFTF001_048438 [Ficus carica]|uniref:Uncharacterized protein n=1 Tax=Ficus carica TaxID=3494 RepID=A0AA88CUB1_FICCA|nr:hypothetical protein TIFTF001_048438 [Ficus carica]